MKLQKALHLQFNYCLSLGLLTLIGSSAIASQPAQAVFVGGGKTSAPSYVFNVPNNGGYQITPLLTVGDEVPLLQGSSINNLTTVQNQNFAFTGIPDGLGLFQTQQNGATVNYVFVNQELGGTAKSDISTTRPGEQITGARVSLFKFDQNFNALGGMNLIGNAVDSLGAAATPIGTTDTTTSPIRDAVFNFSRFCSGYLAQSGFVDASGNAAPIWFAPEESGATSRGWAVTPDGTAQAIDGLGRYAKENVLAASQYRAGNPTGKTVLLSTEDNTDGEMYMFVSPQTQSDPNGFKSGQLYALKVNAADFEGQVSTGPKQANWTLVDQTAQLDATGSVLSNYVNQPGRSTNFRRLEDIAEDPNNPGTFYFVTTGTKDTPGTNPTTPDTPDTTDPNLAENPYGRLYRFSLNPTDPTGPINNFEMLVKGGPGKGVSYDNVVVDKNGNVVVLEDETAFGGEVMAAENRDGRVYSYNIASKSITPLFGIDENAAGSQFNDPTNRGQWETSGIIEASSSALPGRSSYLFDVQAHTITGAAALNGNHVEGGQLILATPVPFEPSPTLGLLILGGAWGVGSQLKKHKFKAVFKKM